MRWRRVTTLIAFVAALSACSGGTELERSDADNAAGATTNAQSNTPRDTSAGVVDGVDEGAEPTIAGAAPATIAGEPIDGRPADPQDDQPPDDPGTTAPAEPVAPPDAIARVISLAPTHTETIFAIGAGDLLIAVDPDSDFPDAAIPLQNDELRPSTGDTGAIEALQPDLVIVGDDPTDLAGRLGEIGIPAWKRSQPDSIEGAYEQIRELGRLLGAAEEADALVAEMRSELGAIRSTLPADGTLTYFHENDPGFITPAAGSFIDLVYGELGLAPIATAGENRAGFVQSNSDEVIAGDPDVIVLADIECCGVTSATAAGRPGWSTIAAIRSGAVAEVPDALTQRWGPRLVDWWRLVADVAARAGGA